MIKSKNLLSESWSGGPVLTNIAKLSSSWLVKWLVELRLALSLITTTHPHPREVEMQLEIGHIYGQ